jgi:hypothetical protein
VLAAPELEPERVWEPERDKGTDPVGVSPDMGVAAALVGSATFRACMYPTALIAVMAPPNVISAIGHVSPPTICRTTPKATVTTPTTPDASQIAVPRCEAQSQARVHQ